MEDILKTSDFGLNIKADIEEVCDVVSKCIYKTLSDVYKCAGKLTQKNKETHFMTFQKLLLDFKIWDKKTKIKFSRKVKRNLNDVDDLIRKSVIGITKLRFLSLASEKELEKIEIKRVLKAIDLCKTQLLHDFLYESCLMAIMKIYTYPFLFDNRKKLSTKNKQEKRDIALSKISEGIKSKIFDKDFSNYTIKSAIIFVKGLQKSSKKSVTFKEEKHKKSVPKQDDLESDTHSVSETELSDKQTEDISEESKEEMKGKISEDVKEVIEQKVEENNDDLSEEQKSTSDNENEESGSEDDLEECSPEEEDYWSAMRKQLPDYIDNDVQENQKVDENQNEDFEQDVDEINGEVGEEDEKEVDDDEDETEIGEEDEREVGEGDEGDDEEAGNIYGNIWRSMHEDADNQLNELSQESSESKIINLDDSNSKKSRKSRRKKILKRKKKSGNKQKSKYVNLNLDEDDKDIINMLKDEEVEIYTDGADIDSD